MKKEAKALFWFIMAAVVVVFAAAPPSGNFVWHNFWTTNRNPHLVGTNGISIVSNAVQSVYIIDGSGISGGGGSNFIATANGNGTNTTIRGLTVTVGQTNTHLTASKIVLTGPNQELISSAFGESDLATFVTSSVTNGLATISFVNDTVNFSSNALVTLIVSSTNGLQRALQFNANQFTVVNGTNVSISSGALVTNLAMFGNSTWGGGLSTLQSDGSLDINLMSQLFADGTANFASGGFFIAADGSASLGIGPFISLSTGGDSTFMAGINWFNGASALVNDGLIFLGPLTANTLLSLDASKKTASIPNGVGGLTNNGTGGMGWSPLQPASSILTNLASGALPTMNPFIVLDNVAYYPTNPWTQYINENWIGDVSITSAAQAGTHGTFWTSSGSTISQLFPIDGSEPNYISIITTNAAVARSVVFGVVAGSSFLTNANATAGEYILLGRFRFSSTNTTANSVTTRFGWSASATITEPTAGIWIMNNTNATNSHVCGMARASSRTLTYNTHASNVYNNFTWLDWAIRVDPTGTNAFYYVGPSYTNLTCIATNNTNFPETALAPVVTIHRIVGNGSTRFTNYCAYVKAWRRPTTSSF